MKKTKKRFSGRIKEVFLKYLAKTKYSLPVDVVIYTPEEVERGRRENRLFLEKVLKEGQVVYERT